MKNLSIITLLILALSTTSLNNKAEITTVVKPKAIVKTPDTISDTLELRPILTQLVEMDSLLKEIEHNGKK